jgi:membrane-associated phospholipid phosphatase|tara:strand:+ start:2387 stop:3586 length:1200 start_codon:yes stop_codon:yes gene_type:complete
MFIKLLRTKQSLAVMLAALFAFNYVETQLEQTFQGAWQASHADNIASAFQQLEGGFQFHNQELTSKVSIVGYSLSYFLLFHILVIGVAVAFWRRDSLRPFRVYSVALGLNYCLCLPFYLFFPVLERWAYPGSSSILVSDLLSPNLIEMIRPISGLDNCFPSIHVSFSVTVALAVYRFNVRWRHCVLCLSLTVILSTFALGIHWGPDIAMGAAVAVLGFALAIIVDQHHPDQQWAGMSTVPHRVDSPLTRLLPSAATAVVPKMVFISYRREKGSNLARIVSVELERRGVSCFLDVDDLGAAHFDERLLRAIESSPNFILILAPGSLDRCSNDDDWLRLEISHALKHRANIVPIMVDDFRFPDSESLPEDLQGVERFNGVTYNHEYFSATFDRLQRFLKIE